MLNKIMKKLNSLLLLLLITFSIYSSVFAQANSVKLNNTTFFNSITSAYAAIGIVSSPQIIELLSAYTGANEVVPITLRNKTGVSSVNTITILPRSGANGLLLTKSNADYIFRFDSCQYVIIDGRPGGINASSFNFSVTNTGSGSSAGVAGFYGARHCIIKFVNATGVSASSGCKVINIGATKITPSKYCSVSYCRVMGGDKGIQDLGTSASVLNSRNYISNNDISKFYSIGFLSSNSDSMFFQYNHVHSGQAAMTNPALLRGIQISGNRSSIDSNDVDNLSSLNCISFIHVSDFGQNNSYRNNNIHDPVPLALNFRNLTGMQFSSGSSSTIFLNNRIHDFKIISSTASTTNIGISILDNGAGPDTINIKKNKIFRLFSAIATDIRGISAIPFPGSVLNIENNFVSLNDSNNTGNDNAIAIYGMYFGKSGASHPSLRYESNVYFNSIKIGGTSLNTANIGLINSYCLFKDNDNDSSVFNEINNICINARTSYINVFNCANAINNTHGILNIDHNIYFATDNVHGYAAKWNNSLFSSAQLTQYKTTAYPKEYNAKFNPVNFLYSFDLHLAGSSIGDMALAGIPKGILTDIDGQLRGNSFLLRPYKGADEAIVPLRIRLLWLTMALQRWAGLSVTGTVDTITVELRNSIAPYAIVDSDSQLSGDGMQTSFEFSNAANKTSYYIVMVHRNSIRTWSSLPVYFSSDTTSYDFTVAQSKAYGNNQINVGGKWCLYAGDVNQDRSIDLSDIVIISNDATNFITGYKVTDLNGDNITDLNDLLIAYNNASIFVNEIFP